jgi:hypothetical protein
MPSDPLTPPLSPGSGRAAVVLAIFGGLAALYLVLGLVD